MTRLSIARRKKPDEQAGWVGLKSRVGVDDGPKLAFQVFVLRHRTLGYAPLARGCPVEQISGEPATITRKYIRYRLRQSWLNSEPIAARVGEELVEVFFEGVQEDGGEHLNARRRSRGRRGNRHPLTGGSGNVLECGRESGFELAKVVLTGSRQEDLLGVS